MKSWITGGTFGFDRSLEELERAWALAEAVGEDRSHRAEKIEFALADVLLREHDYEGATRRRAGVLAGFTASMGPSSSYCVTVQTNLGVATHRAGRHEEADDAPQIQQIRVLLAELLIGRGDRSRGVEAATLLEGVDPKALRMAEPDPDWPGRLQRARDSARDREPDLATRRAR